MSQINLKLVYPRDVNPQQFNGLLLSFFDAVSSVTEGTRKATYFNHFYRERLNKKEKRVLSAVLGQLLKQLSKMNEATLVEEKFPSELPKEFDRIINHFSLLFERYDFEGADSFSSDPFLNGRVIERCFAESEKTHGGEND